MKVSYYIIPGVKTRPKAQKEILIRQICHEYDVSFESIKSRSKKREIVFIRQLLMWVLKKKANLTHVEIGNLLHRDHTSVTHGLKSIQDYIDTNSFNKRDEILKFY